MRRGLTSGARERVRRKRAATCGIHLGFWRTHLAHVLQAAQPVLFHGKADVASMQFTTRPGDRTRPSFGALIQSPVGQPQCNTRWDRPTGIQLPWELSQRTSAGPGWSVTHSGWRVATAPVPRHGPHAAPRANQLQLGAHLQTFAVSCGPAAPVAQAHAPWARLALALGAAVGPCHNPACLDTSAACASALASSALPALTYGHGMQAGTGSGCGGGEGGTS